jgi:L-ascorbate metabolism protein UlaG (beta-lactamase superfamily)
MMKGILTITLSVLVAFGAHSQAIFPKDTISTSDGPLVITFVGHASLIFEWHGEVIHIDPSSREANYYKLPKATMIFVTHDHGDHCDPASLKAITTDKTKTFMTSLAHEKWNQGMVLRSEQTVTVKGIEIATIPAYNLKHKRDDGTPYHVKGEGNSYILTLGDTRIFIGGDTENTPEMKALKDIDIAFLPMNLPYTMTPAMVADAARAFKPKILYVYHYGKSDLSRLRELLADESEVDLRIRKM